MRRGEDHQSRDEGDADSDPDLLHPLAQGSAAQRLEGEIEQVAAVQQLGGKTVPRSERIRFIANLIGYEGYQDLDGAIVFKPPYYNLDVTNLGTDPAAQGQGGSFTSSATSAASYIRANANPFVVYLSEIETETEVEDEANVRATRMCVQPDFMSNLHFPSAEGPQVLPVADHIDKIGRAHV